MADHGTQSGIYQAVIIGDLRPKIMCLQFHPGVILGPRTWNIILPSGHSDVEQLAGSCPFIPIEPSGFLNFGSGLNVVESGGFVSRTAAFIFMPRFDEASGISSNISVFNMKLWLETYTAFSGLAEEPYVQMLPSGVWRRNLILESGAYGAYEVPHTLPDDPNVMRIDGAPWMSGVGQERSQIIYSSLIFPSGEYQVGRYGGLGTGTFRWRFTYDWTARDAHIHIGPASGSYTDY
jgi:hypothetical protein